MSLAERSDLTPSRVLLAILRGWWMVVLFGAAGVLTGEIYLAHAKPYYSAGFTVVPKESTDAQGLGTQARLLLGGQLADRIHFEVMQLIMDSDRLTDELVKRGALQMVFASRWDATAHQWRQPSGIVSRISGFLHNVAGRPTWEAPDGQALRRYIDGHTKKTLLKSSNAVTIRITHDDPAVAYWLAQNVLSTADGLYRADESKVVEGRIAHLKGLLETETNSAYRQNLISLLQTEEQNRMMLSSGENVVSKVVEAPVLPTKPAGPSFGLTLAITTGLGVFLGAVLAVLTARRASRHLLRHEPVRAV